jgi:hypothetical protein
MNKCLVTKLNGSSNNPELLRLGEMRIKILKVSNPTDHTQGFSLGFNKPATLEIVSDGYFTDKTLTENKGKRITLNTGTSSIWVNGNSDVEIAILDKYSLTYINRAYQGEASSSAYGNNIKLNISDLEYSTALTILVLPNTQVSGDISNLKSLTALTSIGLSNTQVPLTGDIGQLSTLSNCDYIDLNYSKLTGDLAKVPYKCRFVSTMSDKGSVFTWSTRPSIAKIIAITGNASLTNIDKMLQDQAQCQVGFLPDDSSSFKTISVAGNRTSASDNAVATLQQKGYTISIAKA